MTPGLTHEAPSSSTIQRGNSSPDLGAELSQNVDMVASQTPPGDSDANKSLSSSTSPKAANSSFKSRATSQRSPLAFEIDVEAEDWKGETQKAHVSELESKVGIEFELAPPKRSGPHKASELRISVAKGGLAAISSRTAALRFLVPEESFTEMDSIIDVQLPDGGEDEFTAAFARLNLAPPSAAPQVNSRPMHSRQVSAPPHAPKRQGLDAPGQKHPISAGQVEPTGLNPPSKANGSYLEDEHTLNIALLGLSGIGNSLLMDTSLDQLKSKPNGIEQGDATFGGSSFVVTGAGVNEGCDKNILEAKSAFLIFVFVSIQ